MTRGGVWVGGGGGEGVEGIGKLKETITDKPLRVRLAVSHARFFFFNVSVKRARVFPDYSPFLPDT